MANISQNKQKRNHKDVDICDCTALACMLSSHVLLITTIVMCFIRDCTPTVCSFTFCFKEFVIFNMIWDKIKKVYPFLEEISEEKFKFKPPI